MSKLLAQPTSLFTLLAILLVILGIIYMKKIKLTRSALVYMGLMLALSFILHQIRLFHMPQGGSVTCGGMLPLLLLSYRYGPSVGFLAGFVYGLLNLFQDPFMLHPLQVIFDYPLPYMVLGLAALWPSHRLLSTTLAFASRFACHYISGAIFFASYAPADTSPYLYSLTFNAAYLLPEFIICILFLKLLPVERLLAVMDRTTRN